MISFAQGAGVAGAGIDVLGGILAAQGAKQVGQGQALAYQGQAAADRAQATADLTNAGTQVTNSVQARTATQQNLLQQGYDEQRIYGAQKAGYAAAGIDPAMGGSPLDVLADTQQQVKQQALNTWYAGEVTAGNDIAQAGYDTQEAAAANQAAQTADQAARTARQTASTSETTSILGGIGSAVGLLAKFF